MTKKPLFPLEDLVSRFADKSAKKPALAPGTLVYVGEERTSPIRISLLDYNEESYEEKELTRAEETFIYRDKQSVSWINIDGVHDVNTIEKIGQHYRRRKDP